MRFKQYIIILLIAMFFLGCIEPILNTKKKHLFGQENAVWSESIYLRGYKPSTGRKLRNKDLKRYASTLKKYNIRYAYLFAGPFEKDGHLPDYSFTDLAKNSIRELKICYPEIVILPWIGGVQNKTVYLNDSIWVKNALSDTKKLIETLNVPGVHIDFEYILKGNSYLDTTIEPEGPFDKENYAFNVNSFHKALRKLLPNSFISSVVVSTSPDTRPWKRKTTLDELSVLVNYIDQLSFLYYDTGINSQSVYIQNCIRQIEDIEKLKNLGTNTQFLMSIGTFINRRELTEFRDLDIENITNTLEVFKESTLKVNDSTKLVDGISIFCDWETSKWEWIKIYDNWSKN